MNNGNRPHSRDKKVGQGTANVGKGRKTGSGSVGFGGRTGSASSGRAAGASGSGATRGILPFQLNFKTILIIALIAVGIFIYFKYFGNMDLNLGETSEPTWGDYTQEYSYSDNSSSYNTPDSSVAKGARDKFYSPSKGDTVTIMVYMCGTDLESKYGMATRDLGEMMKAKIADDVNIIVLTGGCSKWQTKGISNKYNQIYQVVSGKMNLIEDNFGTSAMTDPANLTKFIKYCKSEYPADRNMLIFWDHGGGSISGYGYDEKNQSASSMTLAKIDSALSGANCKFDFIGFDACLMATLETDLVCGKYADYMIASEETEPGTGWYYTNWLTALSNDTAISTVKLGQKIVDDFVASSCSSSSGAQVTLSVVDLAELYGTVPDALTNFAQSTSQLVSSDDYKKVSDARAGVRQFSAENKLNQVDLIDLADRIGTTDAKALSKALKSCVKYNKTTMTRSNGISIYFPYETTRTVSSAVASMNAIGKDGEYTECMGEYAKCIKSFASLEYGGQIAGAASQTSSSVSGDLLGSLISSYASGSSSTSPLGALTGLFGGGSSSSSSSSSAGFGLDAGDIISLLGAFSGRSMPSGYEWVDTELIADKAADIAADFVDPSRIKATEKNGKQVLELNDKEWSLIETVELNVFVRDGNGYIDLGLDNTFELYDNNWLLLEYDGTWLTLDGNVCAYYLVSDTEQEDGSYVTKGRIPATLNGQYVNLQVVFDKNNPYGSVTGAYPLYESEIEVQAKGDIDVKPGDKIELLCDYYNLNGDYDSTYTLGKSFTVGKNGLTLENLTINTTDVSVMYRLTDIYGNNFWVKVR